MIRLFLLAWLAAQSTSPDATQHTQAGLEARKQHQVDTEIAEFRKATELDPASADALFNLGAAYMVKHDYGEAIAPLKCALQLSPELAVAPQFLGYSLPRQGNTVKCTPHLLRVVAVGRSGRRISCGG